MPRQSGNVKENEYARYGSSTPCIGPEPDQGRKSHWYGNRLGNRLLMRNIRNTGKYIPGNKHEKRS